MREIGATRNDLCEMKEGCGMRSRKRLKHEILGWLRTLICPILGAAVVALFSSWIVRAVSQSDLRYEEFDALWASLVVCVVSSASMPVIAYYFAPKRKEIVAIVYASAIGVLHLVAIVVYFGYWAINISSLASVIGLVVGVVIAPEAYKKLE